MTMNLNIWCNIRRIIICACYLPSLLVISGSMSKWNITLIIIKSYLYSLWKVSPAFWCQKYIRNMFCLKELSTVGQLCCYTIKNCRLKPVNMMSWIVCISGDISVWQLQVLTSLVSPQKKCMQLWQVTSQTNHGELITLFGMFSENGKNQLHQTQGSHC